jgi:predicted glycogen debranching enzyme
MNARVGGTPATPRDGKPVELNALWVNALAGLARLTEGAGQDASALWAGHDAAQRSFAKRYIAPTGWLYDLVDAQPAAYPLGGGPHLDDPVLRPNQLFAVALPYAPLDGADPTAVRAVGRALLTPLGLRTLAPSEYGYQGTYGGPETARNEAYHQGTAWPWLIGAYADACHAVGLPTAGLLRGLSAHLGEHGVGSVSEVVDGDPPHRAGGCPFSARSVAEVIRVRGAA